jgi:transcription elongation factor Elf1
MVIVREDQEIARIFCSNCSLKREIPIIGETAPIDAYCQFIDNFYGVEETQEQ